MTVQEIAEEIHSLRARLDMLEAELRVFRLEGKTGTFADLEGILAEESQSTPDEIDDSLFRVPPDLLKP